MATKSGIEVKPFSPCETFFDQLFQFHGKKKKNQY
jgi:hypothetical protein